MIIKISIHSEDVLKYMYKGEGLTFQTNDGFYDWEVKKIIDLGLLPHKYIINGVTCGMSSRTPREILKYLNRRVPSSVDLYELTLSEKYDFKDLAYANILNDFRIWQREWDSFLEDNSKTPISGDEFIEKLKQKYIVIIK